MIDNIKNHEHYIYHYTKCSTAIKYILPSRTLRFSSLENTNDPKESKDWELGIGTNENADLSEFSPGKISNWLSTELKGRAKLLCFSTDTYPITGDKFKDIFNRGFCKPRMWAQYADAHKGVLFLTKIDLQIT